MVSQPEDWDDEEDGEWTAPTIPNPEYKGPWKQKVRYIVKCSSCSNIIQLYLKKLFIYLFILGDRKSRTLTTKANGRHLISTTQVLLYCALFFLNIMVCSGQFFLMYISLVQCMKIN